MFCLTCFTIPLYAIALIVVYQLYRFFVRPNKKLQVYRDQGIPTSFTPYHGFFKQVGIDLAQHGDMYHSWKAVNGMNPKPKAFASNFFDAPLVALKDPELIKQFFMAQEKSYVKAPGAINVAKMILRNGATLLSEGEIWKAHRKLTSPLYNYDALRDRVPEMAKIADAAWDRLKAKDTKAVDMLKETQHVLLEISGKLFLDIELHKLEFKGQTVSAFVAELIDRAALEALNPFTVFFGTSVVGLGLHPRHKALVKDINDLRGFLYGAAKAKLGEILEQRKSNPTQKLPLLLEVLYDQFVKLPKDHLDEVDLVDEFANFVLGSIDTTGHAILFSSYFFMQNTSFQKQLLEEVNRTFKNPADVTLDALNKMDNMSAFLKEVLRMAPPLPHFLPRQAVEDNQIGDLKITAGTVVVVAGVTNSFDSDYHDDADKFIPERWLDENSKTRKSVSKNAYVYIPFLTGARACPGKEIGLNLAKIVFSLFLKKFNFTHADKNYKMAFACKLFHEPLHPLTYTLSAK